MSVLNILMDNFYNDYFYPCLDVANDNGGKKKSKLVKLEDIKEKAFELFPWIKSHDFERQYVIFYMMSKMPISSVKSFKNMLYFMQLKHYDKAADEILNSKWHLQDVKSTKLVAELLREGYIQD